MAKRIVTKIGDVFCIEIDNQYKMYFQYFANDLSDLNSSTIRVFKRKYPMDYVLNIEEVLSDEIELYVHTILRVGVEAGGWYKVGKSKDLGDYSHVLFKSHVPHFLNDHSRVLTEVWYVWCINHERVCYGTVLPPQYESAYWGGVFPYSWIIERLKTGEWQCVL